MADAPRQIKMYSDYKSTYAYMAFEPGLDLEKRYRVTVRWMPFQLRLKGRGERTVLTEYKVRYSYLDSRRWGNERGLWFKGPPKIYNTRPALIGGLFAEKHGLLREYSKAAFHGFWMREFEPDLPEQVVQLVQRFGLSGPQFREYLEGQGQRDYEDIQNEAESDRCFGVPFFIFENEPFWGYDRLGMLEQRLKEAGLARYRDDHIDRMGKEPINA